jgi:2-oxoglutarate ferredoxin oxidoreductase subunit gamma
MSAASRIQIRIGGEAGQGVILTGVVLAQAAMAEQRQVAQSARYGAAMRGGDATADVVIADDPIDFPHVEIPDYLVVLSQPTYDRLATAQPAGTLVIHDPFFVQPGAIAGVRQVSIPATERAIAEFGKSTGANLIIAGALAELSGAVAAASLRAAVVQSLSARFRETNLRAIEIGRQLAVDSAGAD